jgi:hypothetical protein
VHGVFCFGGGEDGHALELFDAGLGFGGFGGVVAEFVDECWEGGLVRREGEGGFDKGVEMGEGCTLEMGALDHLVVVFAFGGLAAFFFGAVEGVWLCLSAGVWCFGGEGYTKVGSSVVI